MTVNRRDLIFGATFLLSSVFFSSPSARADDFTDTASGLRYFDIKLGEGANPNPGDTCVVHWAGFTEGYQGKRIDNTSARDEPFEFILGSGQVGTVRHCLFIICFFVIFLTWVDKSLICFLFRQFLRSKKQLRQ